MGDASSAVSFPDFPEMVSAVLEKAKVREQNINTRLIVKNQKLAFNLSAYTQVCISSKTSDRDKIMVSE